MHASDLDIPRPKTPLAFAPPPGACDCHVHVVPDQKRFPLFPGRVYTTPEARAEALIEVHAALHIERVVIVTPTFYGTDNAATLDGIKRIGMARARGVAVIDDKTPDAALDAMGRAGIRGIRINLATLGQSDPAVAAKGLQLAAQRLKGRNWHVQVYAGLAVIAAVKDRVATLGIPVVFDHFGGAKAALGPRQPGFDALVELVRAGHAYVKVSGAYRASARADYADAAPLARALIAANPQRILWGSDWPHPDTAHPPGRGPLDLAPFLPIDDGKLLNLLPGWTPDPAIRKAILSDNPARLYGF